MMLHICYSSSDKTVKIWDTGSRQCIHTFYDHNDQVQISIFRVMKYVTIYKASQFSLNTGNSYQLCNYFSPYTLSDAQVVMTMTWFSHINELHKL